MLETDVDSFIVRFVQEKSHTNGPPASPWRGIIRHVQSKEEIQFTQIEDALQFVANYVELTNSTLPAGGVLDNGSD